MKLLFAHGAGAPSSHPWMQRWTELLGELGEVTPFDYPYAAAGKRRPDRHPVLLEAHRQALYDLEAGDEPVVLIGKSMGGRIGVHLALEEQVSAVVCMGFPLCSMGNREKLRDKVLLEAHTPLLFVQGTRDKLAPLDLLAEVRGKMTATNALHIVDTGDHSLMCTKTHLKKQGISQDDVDQEILAAIRTFLHDDLGLQP